MIVNEKTKLVTNVTPTTTIFPFVKRISVDFQAKLKSQVGSECGKISNISGYDALFQNCKKLVDPEIELVVLKTVDLLSRFQFDRQSVCLLLNLLDHFDCVKLFPHP